MIVTFLVCKKDISMFHASIKWMTKLCGEQSYHAYVYYDGVHVLDLPKMPFRDVTYTELDYGFLPYPQVTNVSFAKIAHDMRAIKKNFIVMEPDCMVLKEHWIELMISEFLKAPQAPLVTACANPPWDISTGIGMWPYSTYDKFIHEITHTLEGYDGEIFKKRPGDLHKNFIIQHSYGNYIDGRAAPHEFTSKRLQAMRMGPGAVWHKVWSEDMFNMMGGGL